MRPEKTAIADEIKARLADSPYVILTDFTGLKVSDFSELRSRLAKAGARAMVVKNTLMRHTLKDLKLPDLNGALQGPTAIVYGAKDVAAAATVLKAFAKEFKKPKIKAGILDRMALTAEDIEAIADLPSREVLMAQLLRVLSSPASSLARLLNAPASQLVQAIRAKSEKAT
ncbi:MAG: 50S ribosomal protein L10 [Verrucomicrobia bacterium]|nr:50S ribosomal protein L10 [Verrucomicrobiota bacterium]